MLGGAPNLKMMLCYVRKPCRVVSIVADFSNIPKKTQYRFFTWEYNESKIGEFFLYRKKIVVEKVYQGMAIIPTYKTISN